jgi:Putative Flp pilus-assembly TadE/G-like
MTRILGFGRRSERGQMTALMAVSIVALCAMGAFVMDVGSWFQAHRATQSVADAAALAGAQKLPADPGAAQALANEYATKNGGDAPEITFATNTFPNDTITVKSQRVAPGFLSQVLGIASVNVKADAVARAYNLGSARFVAPLAVPRWHPMLSGGGCPCFGEGYQTTIDLDTGNPSLGAFKVLNIDGSYGGLGQQTLVDWLANGYEGYMPLGWYYSNPGAKYNPQDFEDAMLGRRGTELLFPIYDSVREQGAGFEYNIIGWVGFYVKNFISRGNGGEAQGYFSRVTWEGLASESGDNFFGATVVKLVG